MQLVAPQASQSLSPRLGLVTGREGCERHEAHRHTPLRRSRSDSIAPEDVVCGARFLLSPPAAPETQIQAPSVRLWLATELPAGAKRVQNGP